MRSHSHREEQASALVAILWIIAILSLAVFSATQFLFVGVESEANASSQFRAEALAEQGIALASHPLVERGDDLLFQEISELESFATRISSEGENLNLNTILANGERDRIVLEELFYQWGMRRDEAADLVDSLIDWVDEDDESTELGAERSYYLARERPSHPFNRPFDHLDEALLVRDFDKLVALKTDWRDSFTLLSQGSLDLNEASPELISVATQTSPEAARLFTVTRNGLDEIQGTDDDIRFESVEEAMLLIGLSEAPLETIEARVTTEDPTTKIISTGRYGSIAVETTVTVSYSGDSGEILRWRTKRIE